MLGELEGDRRFVICDMEAGVGAVVRGGKADVVLVVAEPTQKSLEVARRATEIAAEQAQVIVVANRLRDDADLDAVRAALPGFELVAVPDDPAIARADHEGLAPIDADADSAGVQAIASIADRLTGRLAPA